VRHRTGTLTTPAGVQLFRQAWLPDGTGETVVTVVHGYGEHSGRYVRLAETLVGHGCAVHTIDLPGHGRSPGRRGHVGRFSEYVDATRALVAAAAVEHPDTPAFLLGHSMGGLIATLHAEGGDERLEGLILSSPLIALGMPVSAAKIAAVKVLSGVTPTLQIGNPLRPADLCHDVAVVNAYEVDELNHHTATARWSAEALAAMAAAQTRARDLRLPLLVQYAGADVITDPRATERLFAAAGSADKTLLRYDGYSHEIYNELGRRAVCDDLLAWLDERPRRPA
jgi:acylglycerol lipase